MAASRHPIRWRAKIWWREAREALSGQAHQKELTVKDKTISEKDSEILRLKDQIAAMSEKRDLEMNAAVTEKRSGDCRSQGHHRPERSGSGDCFTERTPAGERSDPGKGRGDCKPEVTGQACRLRSGTPRKESSDREYEGKLQVVKSEAASRLRVAEEVERLKDFKTRLSTKMVGESLDAHCSTIFNGELRPLFPVAYFEKDNDSSSGSKGDFIFRDYDGGTEYISIMFEMKNEMDETATKHRNEDFFRKLDADRTAKGCEYAVLVSLLEPDDELYNGGIVDVSHRYPKMYVIRPQFFKAMITLLVNAAKKSIDYQRQLAIARSQSIDVTNFEGQLNAFKDAFGRNYRLASEKFKTAIDEIDKSIAHLQKIKDALIGSENNLRLANDKADNLIIKRLTRCNPTMKTKFDETRKKAETEAPEIKES